MRERRSVPKGVDLRARLLHRRRCSGRRALENFKQANCKAHVPRLLRLRASSTAGPSKLMDSCVDAQGLVLCEMINGPASPSSPRQARFRKIIAPAILGRARHPSTQPFLSGQLRCTSPMRLVPTNYWILMLTHKI